MSTDHEARHAYRILRYTAWTTFAVVVTVALTAIAWAFSVYRTFGLLVAVVLIPLVIVVAGAVCIVLAIGRQEIRTASDVRWLLKMIDERDRVIVNLKAELDVLRGDMP